MGIMAGNNITHCAVNDEDNYSFYQANITLPRVTSLVQVLPAADISDNEYIDENSEKPLKYIVNAPALSPIKNFYAESSCSVSANVTDADNKEQGTKRTTSKIMKNKVVPFESDHGTALLHADNLFIPRPVRLPKLNSPPKLQPKTDSENAQVKMQEPYISTNVKNEGTSSNYHHTELVNNIEGTISAPRSISQEKLFEKDIHTDNSDVIDIYKDYLDTCCNDTDADKSMVTQNSSDSEVSVSSLSEYEDSDHKCETNFSCQATFQPLYSLPYKGKKLNLSDNFNKVVLSTRNNSIELYQGGSLPDLHSLDKCKIKRVTHVSKNDSEPESEPGAKLRYKICPLPPIPSGSTLGNNSALYETIDKFSKKDTLSNVKSEKKTFKDIASLLTLVPRVPTHQAKSRKDDYQLADIIKYLPDRKLKVFVGTWNMKGTKSLPESLDDFLLPPESEYLQDVYIIGTQEGTPFRHEWQVKLQETFGPSHVLLQASNFGVLQLSVFVRRELVWFCSRVEHDTTATRVGHKIKTKGALAMAFSMFGTSFLFITSHFTSHEGKLRDRLNDYHSICQSLQLGDAKEEDTCNDVTNRYDRVFWFGDFNFRVRKTRNSVDKLLRQHANRDDIIIKELLLHDQLNEVRGKIFHGFNEAAINFMPTYKFDVYTDIYDTSSKQRVPSWTDRVLYKCHDKSHMKSLCYNSCNTIKNSDHRPVYGIFETLIEPYKSKFVVTGNAQFDREVYVEANMRRSAPLGSQDRSHVCTVL